MQTQRLNVKYWLMLAVPILLTVSAIALALSQPDPPSVHALAVTNATPTVTAAPVVTSTDRPNLAPPATRQGMTIATPNWETSVPQPLTTSFDVAQITVGRTTYSMWCASCHGDKGQ